MYFNFFVDISRVIRNEPLNKVYLFACKMSKRHCWSSLSRDQTATLWTHIKGHYMHKKQGKDKVIMQIESSVDREMIILWVYCKMKWHLIPAFMIYLRRKCFNWKVLLIH